MIAAVTLSYYRSQPTDSGAIDGPASAERGLSPDNVAAEQMRTV